MSRPEFTKDVASQRLWFFATEGRPSAAPSVEVIDEGGGVLSADADTNVTLESVDTTLAATASAGDDQISIAAGTPTVAETYLLANPSGQKQWVRVIANNGGALTLDQPLEHAQTTSSTFQSTRFYYTLQTADVNALRESCKATATYAVGGLTYKPHQLFDVCRTPLNYNPLTRELLAAEHPDLAKSEWAEQKGSDFERQRDRAWERVKQILRQQGRRPALVVSVDDLENWALAQLLYMLAKAGASVLRQVDDKDAELDRLHSDLEAAKSDALASLTYYDEDESGTLSEGEESPAKVMFVR